MLELLAHPEGHGHWWHLAGEGTASLQEIVAIVEELAGRPIKKRVVGLGMLRVLGLFQPFLRELVEMNYLLTDPFIMDDSALTRLLGGVEKTPLREGLKRALDAARTA